ncbi:MAG: hypothetical protein ACXVPN_10345 [Bacteroidia bacterium]
MKLHFIFLFFVLAPTIFLAQEINGDLSDGGVYKKGDNIFVYGFKDKKSFKVIKYDLNLNIVKQYEKQLLDEVAVAFGIYQYKFLQVRDNKLEFNIFHNLKKSKGVWIKLDFNLTELDYTPYGEQESKQAINSKANEDKVNHTPLAYVDIINGFYDDATFQDQLMKNTCYYQDGNDLYVFQQGDKDITYKFEKGLFNKENGAIRKYKIKSDKGFPVMDQEWETVIDKPYMIPVQVIPSLSDSKQLTFLRNYRDLISIDKQNGAISKKISLDFAYDKDGDFISTICTKYIPEKQVFISCGLITHENKGLKKTLTTEYENRKYFIYVFDKEGKNKHKYEEDLPAYDVKRSDAVNVKYRGMDFQPEGIFFDGNQFVIYAVNTVGALVETGGFGSGRPFAGASVFGAGGANNNSMGYASYGLSNIMIGISVHTLDTDDYSYKYAFFQDKKFSDSKYVYPQTIKFDDMSAPGSGTSILLGESNVLEADLVWKKIFTIDINRVGSFNELKVKSKYTYFIGAGNKTYLFDRGGNDGKYKITSVQK